LIKFGLDRLLEGAELRKPLAGRRVALLAHHTTDVIGSFLWCTAWLIGCYYGNIASYRWSSKNLAAWDAASVGGNEPALSTAGR